MLNSLNQRTPDNGQYNSDRRPLLQFLSKATSTNGEPAFSTLPDNAEIDFTFWPWLPDTVGGCEPDLLLRIKYAGHQKYLVLIEAKLWSGKSSSAKPPSHFDNSYDAFVPDQLAREWRCLKALTDNERTNPVLIYLTADTICPADDILTSQESVISCLGEKGKIFWLSWRYLPSILDQFSNNAMFVDLAESLRYLDLVFFEGFSSFGSYDFEWIYRSG
jgi:hypothetical protein